ncbi:hypothetical protein VTK73DRAFT_1242 [Phialemonium thermophilum]|uniref:Mitochondrial integral membrane protein n=1 Tax=Phialemonium thermophilum TaxID=223376 RepID=A0ABR3Y336_9PEZI
MKWFGRGSSRSRDADNESESRTAAADEHTRLLPNRVDSGVPPYLSPDDPAVSPYNLWTVRLVRRVTTALTLVTFLWWIVQLVSAFVTPPGLHTRGGGFFALSYVSLALITLSASLVFFSTPSKSARILGIIMAALFLLHAVIILAVRQIRHEEIWVGVVTLLWALLMSVWQLVADRTVQWGKEEEEERLTGRPETRRTLGEWLQVTLWTFALFVMDLVLILMTYNLILRAVDSSLEPPGKLYGVDNDKYRIHVYCHGGKTKTATEDVPTVLFEGGEDPVEWGLWQFAENAVKNGSIGRYCFADRSGIAWSDTAPSPLSAGMAMEALSEALVRAGEKGPWVLVSAGIGSIYSRVFSSRHGEDVKGILMIDPLHEDLLHRVGNPGRAFLLWFRGVLSPLGLERVSGALFKGRSKADRVWGRSAYQSGKTIFGKLQESLVADSLTKREVISSRVIQDQNVPVVVISSGSKMREDRSWEEKQRDLTHITKKLEAWDVVEDAPLQVWRTLEGRELIEKRLKRLLGLS